VRPAAYDRATVDTQMFFAYPEGAEQERSAPAVAADGLLPAATQDEWDTLLAVMQTQRFRAGEAPLLAGAADRAVYVVSDGRLRIGDAGAVVGAPAIVGEGAFLDGQPRAVTLTALTDGELLRLSWEAWEALAARHPKLGRDIVADLGRIAAGRLRALGGRDGWTG